MADNLEKYGVEWVSIGWDKARRDFMSAEQANKSLGAELKRQEQASQKAGQSLDSVGASAQKSGQQAQAGGGGFKAMAKELLSVGSAADFAKGLLLGIVGGGVMQMVSQGIGLIKDTIAGAVETTKVFEASLNDLRAQSEAANKEFGTGTGTFETWTAWIRQAGDELKVFTETDMQNATARVIQMTKRFGLNEEQMQSLISRTAELAALKGITLTAAVERTTSAIRGESEASEYLGFTLNDNYLATQTAALGFNKLWKEMDDTEKAQVRMAAIMEQSKGVVGEAAKTTETLVGAQAELNREWEKSQVMLGSEVNPELAILVGWLSEALRLQRQLQGSKLPSWMGGFGQSVPFGQIAAGVGYGLAEERLRGPDQIAGGAPYSGAEYARRAADHRDLMTVIWEDERALAEGLYDLEQQKFDNNTQFLRDTIRENVDYQQRRLDLEEDYNDRILQKNATFWQGIENNREKSALGATQSQEKLDLDWQHREEDLERKIGEKIAMGFGSQEDQDWWIGQERIDFDREKRQAQEQLDLRTEQGAERQELEEEQAIERHSIEMGRMETEKEERLTALDTEHEERLEKIQTAWDDQEGEIAAGEADIIGTLKEKYGDREGDLRQHFSNEFALYQRQYEKLKAFIESHSLPAWSGGGAGVTDGSSGGSDGGYSFQFPGVSGQFGADRLVTSPTMFMAGEQGQAERVSITPIGATGPQEINYHFSPSLQFGDVRMEGGADPGIRARELLDEMGQGAYWVRGV